MFAAEVDRREFNCVAAPPQFELHLRPQTQLRGISNECSQNMRLILLTKLISGLNH